MNIATALKAEIIRLARREAKAIAEPLRKQAATHRKTLAALKAETHELALQLKAAQKRSGDTRPASEATVQTPAPRRMGAAAIRALRTRLGVSQEQFALVVDVSAMTVWNWEADRARPRPATLEALHALRGLKRAEVEERLAIAETAAKRRKARARRS